MLDVLTLFQLWLICFSRIQSKMASDFKCITLWSMVHGLVGILRKVQVVGDDFEEGVGPISTASVIATNLEDHLDKVLTGLIQS